MAGVRKPTILPGQASFQKLAEKVLRILARPMLAVAMIHIAAARKHQWIDGHCVIQGIKWKVQTVVHDGRHTPSLRPAPRHFRTVGLRQHREGYRPPNRS